MTRSRLVLIIWVLMFVSACVPTQATSQGPNNYLTSSPLQRSYTAIPPTPFQPAENTQIPTSVPTETPPSTPTATIPNDPELIAFIQECYQPSTYPTCLYSKGLFSFHLDYGGAGNLPDYGARVWDEAWVYGQVIGILAHDYKDGKYLSQLTLGSEIYVIQSTGSNEKYVVVSIERWQSYDRLKHLSPWDGGQEVDGVELVDRYYRGGTNFDRLVFQTCINGDEGLLFVVAYRQ